MDIQFLGTGAGQPSKFRNVSSFALKMLNESNQIWLFDVGEATQHQILKSNVRSRKVNKIFISHLHGDHSFGLPGFLTSRNFQASETIDNGKPTDLTIYAPKGIKDFVLSALKMGHVKLDYHIDFVDLNEGVIFEDEKYIVSAFLLNHNLPTFAFRVEEKNNQGQLDIDSLLKLGIKPGPILSQIKNGETVVLEDGREINGKNFIWKREGRIFSYIPDTKFTENIINAAKDADVVIHESTYSGEESKTAKKHNHSTSVLAAKNAKAANAKKLILNHISSRYIGKKNDILLSEARDIFPNTFIAKDLLEVEIPQKEAIK